MTSQLVSGLNSNLIKMLFAGTRGHERIVTKHLISLKLIRSV